MKELWVEKYRPKKLEDYVFRDNHQKARYKHGSKMKVFRICCLVAQPVSVKLLWQRCLLMN